MGVFSSRDLFDPRYITAIITDSRHQFNAVAIKHTLGDYFVTEIEGQEYVFKLEGSRVYTYKKTAARAIRIIMYDTSHYMPIAGHLNKELEKVMQLNSLPKINYKLFNIFKLLGSREKKKFVPHKLSALIKEISEHENEYSEQVQNMKNYLEHLKVDQIVTPLRNIAEFIEDDLVTTDSKFIGTIISSYQRTDIEHKKVTNSPITAKIAWMKIIAILAIIGAIIAIAIIIYNMGIFSNGIPGFPTFGEQSQADIMQKYGTPEALKDAINRGEVDYDKLPPNVKKMVDSVKDPEAIPIP